MSKTNFQVQTVDFVRKICGFFIRYVTLSLLKKIAQKIAQRGIGIIQKAVGLNHYCMNSYRFSSCVQFCSACLEDF